MIRLRKGLSAWKTPEFTETIKHEIRCLNAEELPLQQGLAQGSYPIGENFGVMIISVFDTPETLQVKAGIFFSSIIAGCHCADDPTPMNECAEYCEMRFDIDKRTANTQVFLLSD